MKKKYCFNCILIILLRGPLESFVCRLYLKQVLSPYRHIITRVDKQLNNRATNNDDFKLSDNGRHFCDVRDSNIGGSS